MKPQQSIQTLPASFYIYRPSDSVSYTHLDVYKRQSLSFVYDSLLSLLLGSYEKYRFPFFSYDSDKVVSFFDFLYGLLKIYNIYMPAM